VGTCIDFNSVTGECLQWSDASGGAAFAEPTVANMSSTGTSLGTEIQQWIGTLTNVGLNIYKTVSGTPGSSGAPPVRGVGIPGSAGQMAPATGAQQVGTGTVFAILAVLFVVWSGLRGRQR